MYIVLQVSPCKFRILQQRELTSQTLHTDTKKDVNPFQLAKPELDHICSSINQVTWLFYLLETLFLWLIENSLFLYIHTCSGIQNFILLICFETKLRLSCIVFKLIYKIFILFVLRITCIVFKLTIYFNILFSYSTFFFLTWSSLRYKNCEALYKKLCKLLI